MRDFEDDRDDVDRSPEAPPMSSLSPNLRQVSSPSMEEQCKEMPPPSFASRDRSRSPIASSSESAMGPAGIVIRIYGEDGMALDDGDDDQFFGPGYPRFVCVP
ncbi:uncharacterized protein LOC119834006 isoform X2 [Zerene cesonia]|uniref:uncharacterized protein LOC119834006 isoform X2 n=1 Tax=Zerene cesonia TaxID=33412 RepID=UPI0018E51230|nr:uncharacterized protein LOC119834006 isoform X2 [Zerene cesonia]